MRTSSVLAILILTLSLPHRARRGTRRAGDHRQDSPKATPAGATFTAPAAGRCRRRDVGGLDAPEGGYARRHRRRHREATRMPRRAGWAAYKPGFNRPLRSVLPQAPRDGGKSARRIQYETSPNERRASAPSRGARGRVDGRLIDGTEPTMEKRGAPWGSRWQPSPKGIARDRSRQEGQPAGRKRIGSAQGLRRARDEAARHAGVGLAFIDGGRRLGGGLGVKELGKPEPWTATRCSSRRRTPRR
jgi:hypothetical protein